MRSLKTSSNRHHRTGRSRSRWAGVATALLASVVAGFGPFGDAQAADVTWLNPVDGNWSDGTKWSGGAVPGPGDTAIIDAAASISVTLDMDAAVTTARVGGASGTQALVLTGHTLTVSDSLAIGANGRVDIASGAVGGAGILINEGTLRLLGSGVVTTALMNAGEWAASGAGNQVSGTVTTQAGSSILVDAGLISAHTDLTITNGFANHGHLELTQTANGSHLYSRLYVTNGTLNNANDGTILCPVGNSRGYRELNVQLMNNGLVTTDWAMSMNRADSDHTNNHQIVVAGADLTVNQSGADPSFANNGTIAISAGRTFGLNGGELNYDPGAATGDGRFRITNVTGVGGATLPVGSADFLLAGGNQVDLVTNSDVVLASGAGNTITTFVANPASELRVDAGINPAHTDLTITNGFANHGHLELTQTANGSHLYSRLYVTNGTLNNANDGTILCPVGNSRGYRELNVQLMNNGLVTTDWAMSMNRADSDHTNNYQIVVAGADLTVNQSGGTPSFANNGTIAISAGRTFGLNGGELTYDPGAATGDGRFRITNVTGVGGATLPVGSADFLLAGGNQVDLVTNSDVVLASGAGNSITTFVANPASELRVDAGINPAHTDLTITNGFANHGHLELTQTANGSHLYSRLYVTNGTLNNANDGTILCPVGNSRGYRELNVQLMNNGLVTTDWAMSMNRADSDHTNNYQIVVAGADLTVNQSGADPSFANNGTIAISAGRTFGLNGGELSYDPGAATGDGRFRITNVTGVGGATLPVGSADFLLAGGNQVDLVTNSDVVLASGAGNSITTFVANPASELRVDAGINPAHTDLTITNGFANHGHLELTQTANGSHLYSRLYVTNGTLNNANDGTILCPVGNSRGYRELNVQLMNNGLVTTDWAMSMNRADSDHTNNYQIVVAGADLTVNQSGADPSFANNGTIAISAGRTFGLNGGELNYDPGAATGDGRFRITNVTGVGGATLPVGSADFLLAGGNQVDLVTNSDVVLASGAGNSITTFVANPASELRVDAGINPAHTDLTITNGFANHGHLELTQTASGSHLYSRLYVTNGTLNNANDGTILCPVGNSRGYRELNVQLMNNGLVTTDWAMSMNRADSDHTNNHQIVVAGADLTVNQSGADPSFANNGTIAISAGRTFALNGGELNYDPGAATGDGRFRITNVTGVGGATLPVGSADFLLAGGNQVDLVTNSDVVLASGAGNSITTFVANPASELRVDAGINPAHTDLTITNGFANHGHLELTQTANGSHLFCALHIATGVLDNAFDGTISCPVGNSRGYRSLNGAVESDGRLEIFWPLTATVGPVANRGSGVVQGAQNFDVSAVSFTDDGTTIPGASPGILTITGDDPRSASSALNVEIGGRTVGTQHDQLAVTGTATLAGGLNVSLIDGFEPALGDSFFVVTAGARLGEFDAATGLDLPGGLQFDIDYRPDAVVLRAGTPPSNSPPVAVADTTATPEDTPIDIAVLLNDFDVDGDSLSVVPGAFSDPPNGTVSLNPDQTVHYVPNPDFFGSDSLTYVISDQRGGNDTTFVHVTVLPVNDAPRFVAPTPSEGTKVTVQPGGLLQFVVTAMDVDPGDTDVLEATGLPAGATMSPALPGSGNPVSSQFSWSPTNADIGSYALTFTATDDSLAVTTRNITVLVEMPTTTIISRLHASPTEEGIEVRWEISGGTPIYEQRLERSGYSTGPWEEADLPRLDADSEFALDRSVQPGTDYYYRLVVVSRYGDELVVGPVTARSLVTITSFSMSAPSPNPTRGAVQWQFSVPHEARVQVVVFDVSGRRVATLADGVFAAGRYQLAWDGEDRGRFVAPGVYFARFVAPEASFTRRIVMVR